MSKRRTPDSGFMSTEVSKAICTLEELRKRSEEQAKEEGVGEAPNTLAVLENIANLLETLRAKAEAPLSFSFPSVDFDILFERLNISSGLLFLNRENHLERVAQSVAQGGDVYMSSHDMYRHLNMLENLVPRTNKAGVRLWIETIFFRVSAMLSDQKRMVLNIEQRVPSVDISVPGQTRSMNISGTIDYVALTTDARKHELFLKNSHFQFFKGENPNGLFVTEAKQHDKSLAQHIPQTVAEMYASAKFLEKDILRGALTNGHDWIFLILYLNKEGNGGTYIQSPTIEILVSDTFPYHVVSPGPDIVVGILAYWMERSFADLDENDWFSTFK